MIVVVGQSHIHQNSQIVVVDACPANSFICLAKSYPKCMCNFVWARARPTSLPFFGGWLASIHIPWLLLMAGTHPDSMVVADSQFLY